MGNSNLNDSMPLKICNYILAPVKNNLRFFIAASLLCAAIPWIFAITQGAKILWLILFATVQGISLSYLLTLLISAIRNRAARQTIKTILLAILSLITIIDAGTIATTGQLLTTDSVNLLLETSLNEANGFFAQYLSAKAISILLLFSILVIAISLITPIIIDKVKSDRYHILSTFILTILTIAAVIVGLVRIATLLQPLRFDDNRQLLSWASQDPGNPVLMNLNQVKFGDPLSKWSYILKELSLQQRDFELWENTQATVCSMSATANPDNKFNIIIIIGESFIRSHSSLYGYYLQTSPRLTEEHSKGNLAVFSDMLAPANFTTTSMRNFLNLNDLASAERWAESAYFPLVVKNAGWKVAHFDNQTISRASDTGISRMLYSEINLTHTYDAISDSIFDYDGDFTAYLERSIRPREIEGNKLVTYHLWGQHFAAADRFPGVPRFSTDDITIERPWLDEQKRQEIADYDSATFYNDSVVGKILDYWRETPAIAIYFSDHGEDCWDIAPIEARNRPRPDDKEWLDRQYHIPFFIWMSDDFRRDYPNLVNRIFSATDRPAMLDNLGQIVLGIADISTPYYNAERDLTSTSYQPRRRVTAEGYEWDDDEMLCN